MEAITEIEPSTWIEITDDMIKDMGYKTKKNKGHDRTNVFKYIKNTYVKDTQYKLNPSKINQTFMGWTYEACIRNDLSSIR